MGELLKWAISRLGVKISYKKSKIHLVHIKPLYHPACSYADYAVWAPQSLHIVQRKFVTKSECIFYIICALVNIAVLTVCVTWYQIHLYWKVHWVGCQMSLLWFVLRRCYRISLEGWGKPHKPHSEQSVSGLKFKLMTRSHIVCTAFAL